MGTIFDVIQPGEKKISSSDSSVWMSAIREARTTGVFRLSELPGETTLIHQYLGRWVKPTLPSPGEPFKTEFVTDIELKAEMFTRFIPLTAHGLIHSHLLMCAELHLPVHHFHPSDDAWFDKLNAKRDELSLIKLTWDNAAASILFDGVSSQPNSIYISENQILDEAGIAAPILRRKNEQSCMVALYTPTPAIAAWQEIRLRRSFRIFSETLLDKFEVLTGRAIIDSFSRMISVFTASENIEISFARRQLVNNEFYLSANEASQHYQAILRECLDHFSAVIGPRLMSANLREVYASLPADVREDIESFYVLPNGYLL